MAVEELEGNLGSQRRISPGLYVVVGDVGNPVGSSVEVSDLSISGEVCAGCQMPQQVLVEEDLQHRPNCLLRS